MLTFRTGTCISLCLLLAVLLTGCGSGGGVPLNDGSASDPASSPDGEATAGSPEGDPPPPVAEPATQPDHSSPEAILRSIFAGRTAVDLPYLARCGSDLAEKEQLDKVDSADAWNLYGRQSMQAYWNKLETAFASGAATFETDGDKSLATFEVGGGMGQMYLGFIKIGGKWYLDMGE